MTTELGQPLPRWDMTAHFPSLESRELAAAHERLGADVERMAALYDHHDVRGGAPVELTDERLGAFEEVLASTNDALDRLRLLSTYANAFVTTDARDDTAAALASQLQMQSARVRALSGRFDAAGLAGRFGIDVGRQEFWASSLAVLTQRIDQFETLVASQGAGGKEPG